MTPSVNAVASDILGGEPLARVYDRLITAHGLSPTESSALIQASLAASEDRARSEVRRNLIFGTGAAIASAVLFIVVVWLVQELTPADGKQHSYIVPFAGAPIFYTFYVFRKAWHWSRVGRACRSMRRGLAVTA